MKVGGMMPMRFALTLVFLVVPVLVGCGGAGGGSKTGTVSGTVTLSGSPFTEGRVSLYSPKASAGAQGTLDNDGKFTVDGALPVGEYTVSVLPPSPPDPQPGVAPVLPKSPAQGGIPVKYRNATTSGLTFQVEPGKNTLDVKMEK